MLFMMLPQRVPLRKRASLHPSKLHPRRVKSAKGVTRQPQREMPMALGSVKNVLKRATRLRPSERQRLSRKHTLTLKPVCRLCYPDLNRSGFSAFDTP